MTRRHNRQIHNVLINGEIVCSGLTRSEAISWVRFYRRVRGLMAYMEAA